MLDEEHTRSPKISQNTLGALSRAAEGSTLRR